MKPEISRDKNLKYVFDVVNNLYDVEDLDDQDQLLGEIYTACDSIISYYDSYQFLKSELNKCNSFKTLYILCCKIVKIYERDI